MLVWFKCSSATLCRTLSNLAHQTLERQLEEQQVATLLIMANLTKRHSAWTIAASFLFTTWSRAWQLLRQLITRSFATGGLTSRLFRACHGVSDCATCVCVVRERRATMSQLIVASVWNCEGLSVGSVSQLGRCKCTPVRELFASFRIIQALPRVFQGFSRASNPPWLAAR